MTAITDATNMIEAMIGRTVTGQELANIGASFVLNDPYHLGGWLDEQDPPQPREPTNEEVAQHFLNTMLRFGQTVHRDAARMTEREAQMVNIDAAVQAAGDAAVLDFT